MELLLRRDYLTGRPCTIPSTLPAGAEPPAQTGHGLHLLVEELGARMFAEASLPGPAQPADRCGVCSQAPRHLVLGSIPPEPQSTPLSLTCACGLTVYPGMSAPLPSPTPSPRRPSSEPRSQCVS